MPHWRMSLALVLAEEVCRTARFSLVPVSFFSLSILELRWFFSRLLHPLVERRLETVDGFLSLDVFWQLIPSPDDPNREEIVSRVVVCRWLVQHYRITGRNSYFDGHT